MAECEKHCWHKKQGPYYMVVKDGHIVQECCHCNTMREVHADHAYVALRGEQDA